MSVEALLKTKIEDVKEPSQLASGEWELRCGGGSYKDNEDYDADDANSARGMINFMFVPVKPIANVDAETVADGAWRGRTVFKRFYVRGNDDLYEVGKVIGALGVSTEGRDFIDALSLCKNRSAVASVGLRTFKRRDGTGGKENTLTDFRPANA